MGIQLYQSSKYLPYFSLFQVWSHGCPEVCWHWERGGCIIHNWKVNLWQTNDPQLVISCVQFLATIFVLVYTVSKHITQTLPEWGGVKIESREFLINFLLIVNFPWVGISDVAIGSVNIMGIWRMLDAEMWKEILKKRLQKVFDGYKWTLN